MVQVSYPGVYIQEIPSGVHTITGVATSITAFIGRAVRGDVNEPVRIASYGDYVRSFGGLSLDSSMSYAVQHFFQNGGADALIVRVYHKPAVGEGVSVLTLGAQGIAAQGTLTIAVNPVDGDNMKIDDKTYTFDDPAPIAAQGKLTLAANPSAGDTMTIGTKTYTFKGPGPLTNDGDIAIDPVLTVNQGRIAGAINLSGAAGTDYAASTTVHPSVTAGAFSGNDLVLTAKTGGAAGNSIATTSSFAAPANHFDHPTLGTARPGADAGLANTDGSIAIGPDVAATQANIVDAINRTGVPGTQYAVAMTRHKTVAAAGAFASNKLVLKARTVGTAGNNIPTTSSFAAGGNSFGAAKLGTGAESSATGPKLVAASPGAWGRNLRASVDLQTRDPSDNNLFNLEISEIDPSLPAGAPPMRSEKYLNVSVAASSALFVDKVLENRSKLVRVGTTSANRPDPVAAKPFSNDGDDGLAIVDNDISDGTLEGAKHGLWALEKADLFNLLCIPPLSLDEGGDIRAQTRAAAEAYCKKRRAMFIVDPLYDWDEPSDLTAPTGVDGTVFGLARSPNAALFFPRIVSPDPLRDGQLETFVPCGAIAGIMARTDAERGVWKAPAGIEATLSGVSDLTVHLTDEQNGQLNPLGINCLRSFPVIGRVNWGARTLEGADQLASEWKYIPIRRLALMLEESLFRGTKWVVFEPNDEPLWANIRLNVGAYMMSLFRQGAFQGTSPKDAFFVKCDSETTTQNDRDNGIVNILVGFAPLKPAEFVVIGIQQIAGKL